MATTVATPRKRAVSLARMAGRADADTLSNAVLGQLLGLIVDGVDPTQPSEWEEPIAPAEQAKLRTVGTSLSRHAWLELAATYLRGKLMEAGAEPPETIRVTIGWPVNSRGGAIGECWHAEASKDGVREIFVSPTLDDGPRVLGVLLHEMVHACLPPDAKHGPKFRKLAIAVGLCGRMTATEETPELVAAFKAEFIATNGEFPAGGLDPALRGKKKQTTRMLKCVCPSCGYIARTSGQWIERAGPPLCPADKIAMEVV